MWCWYLMIYLASAPNVRIVFVKMNMGKYECRLESSTAQSHPVYFANTFAVTFRRKFCHCPWLPPASSCGHSKDHDPQVEKPCPPRRLVWTKNLHGIIFVKPLFQMSKYKYEISLYRNTDMLNHLLENIRPILSFMSLIQVKSLVNFPIYFFSPHLFHLFRKK